MRPIEDDARALLIGEREDVAAVMTNPYEQDFDRITVCDPWRVRDLVAHMIAVLHRAAVPDPAFTGSPEQNARDVAARRDLPGPELVAQLDKAYTAAADGPDAARLALGVWIHGGDLRDALGLHDAYCGRGAAEAVRLLVQRSIDHGLPPVDVTVTDAADRGLDSAHVCLGDPAQPPEGWIRTDTAGLFRIVARRRADMVERDVVGVDLAALTLFR